MTPPLFDGLIFDMDGTLTRPALDFAAMRRETGLGPGDLATQIQTLPPARRRAAWAIIERHETRAMQAQALQDGAEALLRDCRRRAVKLAIATRNARRSVDHLCARFGLAFDAVVSREFPHMKPAPEVVRHILDQWALPPPRVLTVGDYLHDLECGRAAGTATCFFHNPGHTDYSGAADYTVDSMAALAALVFPGEACAPGGAGGDDATM